MYRITEECVSCGTCISVCPARAIKVGFPYCITSRCTQCGKCEQICPVEAIIKIEQ